MSILTEHVLTDLQRLRLSIAKVVDKVLTVPREDAVVELSAHERAGVSHNDSSGAGLVLLVQRVVDFPPVGSHHIPELLLLYHCLVSYHRHYAVDSCPTTLSWHLKKERKNGS